MALRILTWLISLGLHGAFAIPLLLPEPSNAALEQGTGDDIMVIEKGIALEGVVKLGEDVMSIEEVKAPPVMSAVAQPLPERTTPIEEIPVEEEFVEQIKPIEHQVVASDTGPEQINVKEPDPEEMEEPDLEQMKEPEPTLKEVTEEKVTEVEKREAKEVKDLEPDEVEQLLPQQVATIPTENVIAMRESSSEEQQGGDATARRAYLGTLYTHLQRKKVIPRTTLVGTAIVQITVNSKGELVGHKIIKSSGSPVLDNAAVASVKRASPFPSIPTNVEQDTVQTTVPFKFSVRKKPASAGPR